MSPGNDKSCHINVHAIGLCRARLNFYRRGDNILAVVFRERGYFGVRLIDELFSLGCGCRWEKPCCSIDEARDGTSPWAV